MTHDAARFQMSLCAAAVGFCHDGPVLMAKRLVARLVALVLALVLGVAACTDGSADTPNSEPNETSDTGQTGPQILDRRVVVRVGAPASVETAPLHLAINREEFTAAEVAVRAVPVEDGQAAITGVIAGSTDVGYAAATDVIRARAAGIDIRILVAGPRLGEPSHLALVTTVPTRTRLSGLPAGEIALPSQAVLAQVALELASADAELPENHFEFTQPTHAETLAGLADGSVVAAVLEEPYLRAAVSEGATVIGRPLDDLDLDLQLGYWFTTDDALRNKRAAVLKTATVLALANDQAGDFSRALGTIAVSQAGDRIPETTPPNLVQPSWGADPDATSLERTSELLIRFGLVEDRPDLTRITVPR